VGLYFGATRHRDRSLGSVFSKKVGVLVLAAKDDRRPVVCVGPRTRGTHMSSSRKALCFVRLKVLYLTGKKKHEYAGRRGRISFALRRQIIFFFGSAAGYANATRTTSSSFLFHSRRSHIIICSLICSTVAIVKYMSSSIHLKLIQCFFYKLFCVYNLRQVKVFLW
jgi:hypothetical protein